MFICLFVFCQLPTTHLQAVHGEAGRDGHYLALQPAAVQEDHQARGAQGEGHVVHHHDRGARDPVVRGDHVRRIGHQETVLEQFGNHKGEEGRGRLLSRHLYPPLGVD